MGDPQVLSVETVYSGFISLERLRVRLRDGAEVWRDLERHGPSVAILPYDPERRVALVANLFRVAVFRTTGDAVSQEACAGMIGDEAPDFAVRREALEELGVRLPQLLKVGCVWASPGISDERVHLFLAPYSRSDRVGPGGGADGEHENIEVQECELGGLALAADAGEICDSKLLILVQTLRLRLPQVFLAPA